MYVEGADDGMECENGIDNISSQIRWQSAQFSPPVYANNQWGRYVRPATYSVEWP